MTLKREAKNRGRVENPALQNRQRTTPSRLANYVRAVSPHPFLKILLQKLN
jgi:hypothetical protein